MKLTDQEGQRLVAAMLAMRPDWIPNKPGRMLLEVRGPAGGSNTPGPWPNNDQESST